MVDEYTRLVIEWAKDYKRPTVPVSFVVYDGKSQTCPTCNNDCLMYGRAIYSNDTPLYRLGKCTKCHTRLFIDFGFPAVCAYEPNGVVDPDNKMIQLSLF